MIIVTGCGRSGTSAVARVLHEAGLTMGHDLIEADASNAEGYYEERQVVVANDAILNAAGLNRWFASASREQIIAAATQYEAELRVIAANATPAWKDPRFSMTLEAWMPLLHSRPRLVVCVRNPAEVIASTLRYFGLEGDEPERAAMHTWREECERMLEIIDVYALDAVAIEFAALHRDPAAALAPVARFVERELDASSIRQELRHHERPVPDEAREIYERVLALG